MARAKTNSDVAAASGVSSIPADELADILEAEEAKAPPANKVEELDGGTVRETQTIYEDRTIHPVPEPVVEYSVKSEELSDGTIMETYGPPVGQEDEAAE